MMNETIVAYVGATNKYGVIVLNPDGSLVGGGTVGAGSYDQLFYRDDLDATYLYEYLCEAEVGELKNIAKWRIKGLRTNKTTGDMSIRFASGNTTFDKLATDLATVSAYTYNF